MSSGAQAYLWVALGSALGGVGRHWIAGLLSGRIGAFPLGILFVNVTGSFLIGLLFALTLPGGKIFLPPGGRQLLMVGVLGGYTTFSSFSLETLRLAQSGLWTQAFLNVALSVILCLAAVWIGFGAGAFLQR
jgi:CrcB protein